MAWIELHDTMPDHPKVLRLSRALHVDKINVIGHLACFWTWTLRFRPSGDLDGMDADDISNAARFEGESQPFLIALLETRLLDKTEHGFHVHDWQDYTREYHRGIKERKRLRNKRKMLRNSCATVDQQISTVAQTGPDRTGPDLILLSDSPSGHSSDDKDKGATTPAPPCPAPSPSLPGPAPVPATKRTRASKRFDGYSHEFEAFWQECPRKEGKGDAWKAWSELEAAPAPAALVDRMRAYATRARKERREPCYIKLPAGWLRERRFDDEVGVKPERKLSWEEYAQT